MNLSRSLTCWKEIAQYLGKGVRTVQRWERELGLPIHRPPTRSRGIVRAIPSELDAWMKAQQPPDSEHGETAWLLARIEKLQAENEVLRRAVGSLLARQPSPQNHRQEDTPLESLWEQSVQLLLTNIAQRHRQNQLLEQSRQIRSRIPQATRPRFSAPSADRVRPQVN